MKCDECKDKISLYIDQMVDEAEEKAMVAHLDLCETCHKEYEVLVEMIQLLKPSDEIDMPREFHGDLMRRLKQEQKVIPIKGKRFKWGYPAGLVATFLVGLIVFNQSFVADKNSTASQMPMVASNIDQDHEMQIVEGAVQEEITKEAKDVDTSLPLTNEMKRTVDDTSIEQVVWEITITNPVDFIEVLKTYLDNQQVTYVEEEGVLLIAGKGSYEAFWEWLQTQSEVRELTVIHNKGNDLRLIYHE